MVMAKLLFVFLVGVSAVPLSDRELAGELQSAPDMAIKDPAEIQAWDRVMCALRFSCAPRTRIQIP